jgi:DNA-directed RNA polymerase specialized sigma24 family protein
MIPQPGRSSINPFDSLDAEWKILCHRHRRSAIVARWARREPALANARSLADVVPPAGTDRTPQLRALLRLTAGDDVLAARALLQLLIPGLVRLAARLRRGSEPFADVAAEVISTMWVQLQRVRARSVQCRTADYLLRSVRRDILRARRDAEGVTKALPEDTDNARATSPAAPSAEAAAFAESLAATLLEASVASGVLTATQAELTWLCAVDRQGVPTAAKRTGIPVATAYRLRARAHETLRHTLADLECEM